MHFSEELKQKEDFLQSFIDTTINLGINQIVAAIIEAHTPLTKIAQNCAIALHPVIAPFFGRSFCDQIISLFDNAEVSSTEQLKILCNRLRQQ